MTKRKITMDYPKIEIPNALICFKKTAGYAKVLLQIDEENISTIKKLQPLSCVNFELGDYIVYTSSFRSEEIFDRDLKPKSFNTKEYTYSLSEDKTTILEHFADEKDSIFNYKKIISDDDLDTAKMFSIKAKKGMYIVDGEVISSKDFKENYSTTNEPQL